jgi:hypothetical protein
VVVKGHQKAHSAQLHSINLSDSTDVRQLVLALTLTAFGCSTPRVTIYTPPELAHAAVYVDGQLKGNVSATVKHYRWVGVRKLKEEFSLPPRDESFVILRDLKPGKHTIRLSKPGYVDVMKEVTFDGRRSFEIEVELPHVTATQK